VLELLLCFLPCVAPEHTGEFGEVGIKLSVQRVGGEYMRGHRVDLRIKPIGAFPLTAIAVFFVDFPVFVSVQPFNCYLARQLEQSSSNFLSCDKTEISEPSLLSQSPRKATE
jgi:hypothetical protein